MGMNGNDLKNHLTTNGFYGKGNRFHRQDGDTSAQVTILGEDRAEITVVVNGVLAYDEVSNLSRVAECAQLYV